MGEKYPVQIGGGREREGEERKSNKEGGAKAGEHTIMTAGREVGLSAELGGWL